MRKAGALAVALVAWSGLVGPRLPPRARLLVHGALAGLLVRRTGAPLGLTPPDLWRGVGLGLPIATAVSAAVGTSTLAPPVRRGMAARELPDSVPEWLLSHIPLGTVWSEEAAYRGALGTMAADALGARAGRVLPAARASASRTCPTRAPPGSPCWAPSW